MHLALVVEGTAQADLVRLRDAQPGLEESERPGRGQRGAGEDRGRHLLQEEFPHRRADVDRRGGQLDRRPQRLAAASIQYTASGVCWQPPVLELQAQSLEAIGRGGEILPLFEVVEFLAFLANRLGQAVQARAQGVFDDRGLSHPAVPLGLAGEPLVDAVEEQPGPLAAFHDQLLRLAQVVMDQQAAVGTVVVELVEHVLHLAAGDPQAEMLAGHGFDHVGFVENHHIVVGQDAGPFAAQANR